jgi:hypothetical protein
MCFVFCHFLDYFHQEHLIIDHLIGLHEYFSDSRLIFFLQLLLSETVFLCIFPRTGRVFAAVCVVSRSSGGFVLDKFRPKFVVNSHHWLLRKCTMPSQHQPGAPS